MRIALLVPHIFMDDNYLKKVIFSPGTIAIELAEGLSDLGHEVTLFSPGKVQNPKFKNINADTSLVDEELKTKGYGLMALMSKNPLTYVTLSRQLQMQLVSNAYQMANNDEFDIVHVWITEEDIAMEFAGLCKKPVVFTHHEPFNFLTKYRTSFERYKDLNWISISHAQRATVGNANWRSLPGSMNWVGNIYHGLSDPFKKYKIKKSDDHKKYFAYLGRIIEPKGVHLAIEAVLRLNEALREPQGDRMKNVGDSHGNPELIPLKVAGKHYSDSGKDSYWKTKIEPLVDGEIIQYVGFIDDPEEKFNFLYNAKALIVPSTWEEPFGMISIEANSVGTQIIASKNGALDEVIEEGVNGYKYKETSELVNLLNRKAIPESKVKEHFVKNFSIEKMVKKYQQIYEIFKLQ
jgi:glycosyltransferase involved in cell wall biosynthesis